MAAFYAIHLSRNNARLRILKLFASRRNERKIPMSDVRVIEYTAETDEDRETLIKITHEEMANMAESDLGAKINVLISKPDEELPLKVIAIEPQDSSWRWPREKFGKFKSTKRTFSARL
jgi:hypothetical protein